jgi:hypothetical protein
MSEDQYSSPDKVFYRFEEHPKINSKPLFEPEINKVKINRNTVKLQKAVQLNQTEHIQA